MRERREYGEGIRRLCEFLSLPHQFADKSGQPSRSSISASFLRSVSLLRKRTDPSAHPANAPLVWSLDIRPAVYGGFRG
jgi:hypothetical protein